MPYWSNRFRLRFRGLPSSTVAIIDLLSTTVAIIGLLRTYHLLANQTTDTRVPGGNERRDLFSYLTASRASAKLGITSS
jgi:hypothetical protein